MSWEKVRLGDVTDSCLGKMLDKAKNKGDYYPYLANVNVRWGQFELDDLSQMRFEPHEHERYGLKYGDLVICEGGEPGRCALWKNEVPNMKIQKALHRVRVHDCLDNRYLFYWFLLAGKRGELDQYFSGTTTIKHLPGDKLKTILIEIPDIQTQHRIASILSAYDDLIENNRKQIRLLEEAAQQLYKEWFVDLRFPGHENVAMVDGVPEGWRKQVVSDFGKVITGKTPSTLRSEYYGGDIPFITIPDMHGNIYPLKTEKSLTTAGADTQKSKYLPANSIIVSCIGTVGLVSLTSKMSQTNQQINAVILNDKRALYFLYGAMSQWKALLDGIGSNGATMTNVSKGKFSNIELLCPTISVIEYFEKQSKPLFDKILCLSKQNVFLTEARDRLLPNLMSGEVEV